MKTLLALVGLTTSFFLSGCARDHAEGMTKTASQPPSAPVATFTVNSTGTAPLSYQWQLNGTNVSGVTINGTNTSGVRIIGSSSSGATNR
jgi:hypothetical protein